jgi:streptomycin 6-kinase
LSVLVLERAQPGTLLPDLPPELGDKLLAELLKRLYREPCPFPLKQEREALRLLGIRDLKASVDLGIGQMGAEYEMSNGVRMAQFLPLAALAEELVASSDPGRQRLLHGDLHGHNLLLDRGRLMVIDPIPLWGEPEIDLARALLGPPLLHLPAEIWFGAQMLAEAASVDAERLFSWARIFGALRLAGEGEENPLDPLRRARLQNLLAGS